MDWRRGHTVGRGSTATVSIATVHGSGQVYAVKSAELAKSKFLIREQKILSTFKCHHIVTYRGCDITTENGTLFYNMFMEYAPHGTVFDAIHERGGLAEAIVRNYTRQILLGLQHLHSNGIVHCDIKGQNILVMDEGVKIADLGCARRVEDEVLNSDWSTAGTPMFMAPEVARGEQQGFPADVWALGCTVVEMVTGQAPWPDVADPVSTLYRIGFSGEVPKIPSFMSKQGKDFLSKCLIKNPDERWSVGELLKHGFLEESKLLMKEINGSKSDTPTCVLDQDIWDSMEEYLETIQNPTHNCSSNSPMDRIQQLCGGQPNWKWDDNWVTVRSNGANSECVMQKLNANEPTKTNGADSECVMQELNANEPTKTKGADSESECVMQDNGCSNNSSSSNSWTRSNSSQICAKILSSCKKNVLNGKLHFEIKALVLLHDLLLFFPPLGTSLQSKH
ncbi:Protein kinase-like [Quillaja saponaria]|uniref:Protein kinase-like n=1 Tax=Quillaja saponaria TaxID=32244 RepID=A0AAD7P8R5_QUISA|nr:Protein kinase-like [Quillaja saponaria]